MLAGMLAGIEDVLGDRAGRVRHVVPQDASFPATSPTTRRRRCLVLDEGAPPATATSPATEDAVASGERWRC